MARKVARTRKPQGATTVADGLWTALKASVRRMRYLCDAHTWGSHSHGLGGSGQSLQLVNHWTPNDALKDIELTSGYAEDLEDAPMKSGGSEEGSEGNVQGATSRLPLRVDCGWHYKHQ